MIMENNGHGEPSNTSRDDSAAPKAPLIEAVSIRSMSLITLSSIATLFFIDWAQAVLLPLMVAVLISYALDPLVSTLDHIKIPRPLGAAIVLLLLVGAIAGASIPLQTEAIAILDKVPVAVSKFQRNEANSPKQEESLMEKAQTAAKHIEESAAEGKKDTQPEQQGITPVRVIEKPTDVQDYALKSAPTLLVLVSQLFSVLLLVFFILAVGPLYKRKVVKISGPSFGRMRKAARIMNEFHHQVRRFLFVMLLGGLFVGILTWLAFITLGVEQALFWGVVAGVASA
ncbi:MAG: AI-2E family transporter, partial [Marinobacter sp.]